jgi:hypothetical protein
MRLLPITALAVTALLLLIESVRGHGSWISRAGLRNAAGE